MKKVNFDLKKIKGIGPQMYKFCKDNKVNLLFGSGMASLGYVAGQAGKRKEVDKAFKEAFQEASKIYENKFKKQTDAFLLKEKAYSSHMEEFNFLIEQYEAEIRRLEIILEKSETEIELLKLLIRKKDELLNLHNIETVI